MKRTCEFCKEPATRTTILYSFGALKHIPFWKRWGRKIMHGEFMRRHVCERHYFEFHHGIESYDCPKCKNTTMMKGKEFYSTEKIYCSYCSAEVKEIT